MSTVTQDVQVLVCLYSFVPSLILLPSGYFGPFQTPQGKLTSAALCKTHYTMNQQNKQQLV